MFSGNLHWIGRACEKRECFCGGGDEPWGGSVTSCIMKRSVGQLARVTACSCVADRRTVLLCNLELFFAGESDEVARERTDRWRDDEWRPHHASARIFLRRGSEVRPVARGVCRRQRLLRAGASLCPAERSVG